MVPALIIDPIMKVIDKVVVDKNQRDRLRHEIEILKQKADERDHLVQMGQVEINKIEAASTNWFVAGWRPFIGWTSGVGVAWTFVIAPFAEFIARLFNWTGTMPTLDTGQLMVLVTSMLGLGAMRSWDKARGIDISAKTSGGSPIPIRDVINEDKANAEPVTSIEPAPRKRRFRL